MKRKIRVRRKYDDYFDALFKKGRLQVDDQMMRMWLARQFGAHKLGNFVRLDGDGTFRTKQRIRARRQRSIFGSVFEIFI